MILQEPIPGEDGEVTGGRVKWHRNDGPAGDLKPPIAAGSLVEGERREVEVTPDLVLHLEDVREVSARRNGAVGSVHSVLPGVPLLLHSVPEQRQKKEEDCVTPPLLPVCEHCRGSEQTDQEMRKGSSRLLKTLMMRLSLVTLSIDGPGNCPFINIPCSRHFLIRKQETQNRQKFFRQRHARLEILYLLLDS